MGRGSSKAGTRTGRSQYTPSGAAGGMAPLSENLDGQIRRYYEQFVSEDARGSNDVQYATGEIREDTALEYVVDGSWESLTQDDNGLIRERQEGEITANSGRLYGVSRLPNGNYNVTDIRTGTRVTSSSGVNNRYEAADAIRTFRDRISHDNTRQMVQNAENRFNEVRRRR